MRDKFIYLFIHSTHSQALFLLSSISRSDTVARLRYILNYLIKTGICFRLCDSSRRFLLARTMFLEWTANAIASLQEIAKRLRANHVRGELATD